jgi:hypothetical protein
VNRTKHQDALVREYLRSLGWALRLRPSKDRESLMAEVSEHIALARAELEHPTTEAVQGVLDRLGPPADIAAEATRLADEAAAGRTTWHQDGFGEGSPAGLGLPGLDETTEPAPPGPRRQAWMHSATLGFWADLLVHPPSGPAPVQDAPADWELHTIGLLLGGGLLAGVGWLLGAVRLWRSEVFALPDKIVGTALLPGGVLPAIVLLIWPIGGSGGLVRLTEFGVCGAGALATSLYLRYRLQAIEVHSGFESFRARRAAHADERSRNEIGLG